MQFAADLEKRGGSHLISEISSHALALGRVYGFHFHTAVFTNLPRDHLDFHRTMEDYTAAKRLLFAPIEGTAPAWAILNRGDAASNAMVNEKSQTIWYGLAGDAHLRAENIRTSFDGLHF